MEIIVPDAPSLDGQPSHHDNDFAKLDTPTLISLLDDSEDWPAPALLEAIVSRGADAVAPLIAFVDRPGVDDARAYYAVELLMILGDPAALPTLVRFYQRTVDEYAEAFSMSLPALGEAVFPYFLPLIGDRSLTWEQRTVANEILEYVAGEDEERRRQIAEANRAVLQAYLDDANRLKELPTVDEADIDRIAEVVSWIVADLTALGDEESRPLVQAAFDAELLDEFVVGVNPLDGPFEVIRREYQPTNWMDWYKDDYEHRNDLPPVYDGPEYDWDPDPLPLPQQPYIAPPKPGRNDPCWCGSGKKYKKCHLGAPNDKFNGA